MTLSGRAGEVRAAVEVAFAEVPHPGDARAVREGPCCPDHDAVAEYLADHTWQSLREELARSDDDPGLYRGLKPAAYVYFLPAVLLFVLENVEREEGWGDRFWRPLDWVYAVLIPFRRDEDGERWTREMREDVLPLLTAAQREAVARVLDSVAAAGHLLEGTWSVESLARARSDIELAVAEIWRGATAP